MSPRPVRIVIALFLFVDVEDRRSGAVAHAESQVSAVDDPVASGQLDVAYDDSLGAAAAGVFHQLLAGRVQVRDVGSP